MRRPYELQYRLPTGTCSIPKLLSPVSQSVRRPLYTRIFARFDSEAGYKETMKPTQFIAFAIVNLSLLSVSQLGCIKEACQVIHAADKTCTVIEVMGADGKVERIPVSQADLMGFAAAAKARQATPLPAPSASAKP